MKKLLLALPLVFLTACGGPETKVETDLSQFPVYCIREAVSDEYGTTTIDMPGLYHGRDDAPITVSLETYEQLDVPFCEIDDPRVAK